MLKRTFDVVLGSLLLVAAAPLFGLIAVGVWLDSGRPIFFVQPRSGRRGHLFNVYKFRTLPPGVSRVDNPHGYTTPVGAVLRRWGLDELPQLWNVIRGEMSLVGPRPTLPEQVARYGPSERRRLAVRPGLTGWAQIHGRNALSWSERIRLDVWYVQHRSMGLDLRILLRTPGVLATGTGVYGADGKNPDYPYHTSRCESDR